MTSDPRDGTTPEEPAPPIFIGGTGRSGTTILLQVLRAHSRIFGTRYEGRFLVSRFGLLELERKGFSPEAFEEFRTLVLGDWFKKTYKAGTPAEYEGGLHKEVERADLEAAVAALEQAAFGAAPGDLAAHVREFTARIFESPMRKLGKARWIEKTPTNLLHMQQLHWIFPSARFIHIYRDGRDVAASIVANGWWPIVDETAKESFAGVPVTVENAARFWRLHLQQGFEQARGIPGETLLTLSLESLIEDRERVLAGICEFLEEPLDPKILRVSLEAGHVGRWRDTFSEEERAAFKSEAGEMLIQLGYESDGAW
jgi:hypothetical protein